MQRQIEINRKEEQKEGWGGRDKQQKDRGANNCGGAGREISLFSSEAQAWIYLSVALPPLGKQDSFHLKRI